MRGVWWYAVGGGVALIALVVAGFFVFVEGGGGGSTSANGSGCPPAPSTQSAGNADILARALGKGYNKTIVINVKDKQSGVPLHDAKVSIKGEMTCPHAMPLYEKSLPEESRGTYEGAYPLIMQGQWTIYITVRSKQGDATTSALPVNVKIGN
jgi:hypothetical protein